MEVKLENHLGKHISHFCNNHFTDDRFGHSTHYVGHAFKLDNGLNCKTVKQGREPGANIRTHEVFLRCPKVGPWQEADTTKTLLIFSLEAAKVDLSQKTVAPFSKKGMGAFQDGQVYFYSNTENKVVSSSPEEFLASYKEAYGDGQRLFYGLLPGSDLELSVDLSGNTDVPGKMVVTDPDTETNRKGQKYFASVDGGPRFMLGWSVRYSRRYLGLQLLDSGHAFSGDDYAENLGQWAYILDFIGYCESVNRFNIVNSYDRANFTFGFFQLAAHTPKDNLILFFRDLLKLPEAKAYFPELELRRGKVHRINENGSFTNLEREQNMPVGRWTERQIPDFMAYLNPSRVQVDKQELLHSARLIHWTNNSKACRDLQVDMAFDITTEKVEKRYAKKYELAGMDDITLGIICDIHHNGRAKYREVRRILEDSSTPETRIKNLLRINDNAHKARNRNLSKRIGQLKAEGKIGNKIYDPSRNGFIDGNLSMV